jgi:E3 ubiquitin-protein ligase RNF38/44
VREAQISAWRKALRFEVGLLVGINFALITALITDWNSTCPGHPLKQWMFVELVVQSLLIVPSVVLQLNLQSFFRQAESRKIEPVGLFYMGSRLLNFFWIIWAFVGIAWTFQAKECSNVIPAVYTLCFIMAILNCIIVGLPLLICCFSVPCTAVAYYFYPRIFGVGSIRKASPRLIKKVTTVTKFTEGCGIATEDACCAICLCEYVEGDEIRFLNCHHHFHSECVTDWLMLNKQCPFCKTEIDKKPNNTKQAPTVDADREDTPLATLQH